MEVKKGVGDIMNQLAIISDLLEKMNLDTKTIQVNIDLEKKHFDNFHDKVKTKRGLSFIPKKRFTMEISDVKFTFNKV